jgi:hypothetical protein
MNPLMRALTGPILLTTLGVLLTMDYLGSATIGRTWPVLLIVFGLCKVLEYAAVRSAPPPPPPGQAQGTQK